MTHKFSTLIFAVVFSVLNTYAAVAIKDAGGWLEAAWVEWTYTGSGKTFAVYVSSEDGAQWTKLDYELLQQLRHRQLLPLHTS